MGLKECWLFLWRPGGRWVDRSMEMRISWSWSSLNIPMALQLGGWDTEEQECGAEIEPGSSNHGKGWGSKHRKVEENSETGREK